MLFNLGVRVQKNGGALEKDGPSDFRMAGASGAGACGGMHPPKHGLD